MASFGPDLAEALAASNLPIHWIIADDGSTPEEIKRLNLLQIQFSKIFPAVHLHTAARHFGKGSIVRESWALRPNAGWLAFVDADGSVSGDEMLRLIHSAISNNASALGIRKRTATTAIIESPLRALFHRGFLITGKLLLNVPCEDPQCGAKVLCGNDYRAIADHLRENGLAFDSELLRALSLIGARTIDIPLNWTEKSGGTVRPFRDAFTMFRALLRIRRHLTGRTIHSPQ